MAHRSASAPASPAISTASTSSGSSRASASSTASAANGLSASSGSKRGTVGRALPDFRATAAIIGPVCAGRSTVFRRLTAELQQASDLTVTDSTQAALLRLDYAGRRALLRLCDYDPDWLANFLCEGREAWNPFKAQTFVLVVNLGDPDGRAQLAEWHARACTHAPADLRLGFLVVATHRDLPLERRDGAAQLQEWAKENGAEFVQLGLGDAHGVLQAPFAAAVAASLALDSYPVMRRGPLVKQGAWMRNWKHRLFVLERTGRLRYFAEERDEPKGTIDVTAAVRLLPAAECNNVAWPAKTDPDACFGIVLPNRTYYLVAPSVAAAREWHLDLARLARSADFGLCLEAQSADSTHRPSAGSSSSASTLVGAHSDSSSSHRPSAGSGASVATLTTAEVAGRIARDRQDSASASAAPTGKEDNSFGGAEAAF